MMKTCPGCSFVFQRRKKECCPHCHEPLLISKGNIRLLADKLVVDELLLKLKTHIEKRDHVVIPFSYSENSRERLLAYELLNRTKIFLKAQKEKISITPRDFLLGLLDYILSIKWWAEKLNSLKQLYNKVGELAKDYFNIVKKQYTVEQAEKYRLEIYRQSEIEIHYGV